MYSILAQNSILMHLSKPIYILFLFFIFKASAQNQVLLKVHLKNGDIITGISEWESIKFVSDFGNLSFPVDEVNELEIGLQDSRFDKGNLLQLLDKVNYGNPRERENAFDEIIAMDEGAIPFIKAYLNAEGSNPDNTTDINVQTLLDVMLAKYKIPENYNLQDILRYKNKYLVEGSYSFDALNLKTDYGELSLKRNDIFNIEFQVLQGGMTNKNTFKLYANKNISGNNEGGWLNTGILVKKGEKIRLTATGQIILASLSGKTFYPNGNSEGKSTEDVAKPNFGQVVFKIGSNGVVQKGGASNTIEANATGIIYLSIYESIYNTANSGNYTINLKIN